MVNGYVQMQQVNTIVHIDTIGIDVSVLNGRRMAIMSNSEVLHYRGPRNIIRYYFQQEYPDVDLEKLDMVLSKYRDDEIERFADMVCRFGLAAILDSVYDAIK
jgi:hypothetical protein